MTCFAACADFCAVRWDFLRRPRANERLFGPSSLRNEIGLNAGATLTEFRPGQGRCRWVYAKLSAHCRETEVDLIHKSGAVLLKCGFLGRPLSRTSRETYFKFFLGSLLTLARSGSSFVEADILSSTCYTTEEWYAPQPSLVRRLTLRGDPEIRTRWSRKDGVDHGFCSTFDCLEVIRRDIALLLCVLTCMTARPVCMHALSACLPLFYLALKAGGAGTTCSLRRGARSRSW